MPNVKACVFFPLKYYYYTITICNVIQAFQHSQFLQLTQYSTKYRKENKKNKELYKTFSKTYQK